MPQDYPQAAVPPSVCRAAAETDGRALDRRGVGMSDFWHKMGCCVVAKPPPVRTADMKHYTDLKGAECKTWIRTSRTSQQNDVFDVLTSSYCVDKHVQHANQLARVLVWTASCTAN